MNFQLHTVLDKYKPRNQDEYSSAIFKLKEKITSWAGNDLLGIYLSGSCQKGTAISLSSDIDLLISLSNTCPNTLKEIYNSLTKFLGNQYEYVRKQNVSLGLKLDKNISMFSLLLMNQSENVLQSIIEEQNKIKVDVTPAKLQPSSYNDHSVYVSKKDTWTKTNINKHINDISNSGYTNEIKLIKIWRELNNLSFPSIYLEYLVIKILSDRSINSLSLTSNLNYILEQLAKESGNPLTSRIQDPANSNNILSDLLSEIEKRKIIIKSQESLSKIIKPASIGLIFSEWDFSKVLY